MHQLTRHFGTLHCEGDRANSWHIFETLQGSCLTICKVLGESTQISEKLELVTKIMFGYHGNKKSAAFYQDFRENQQFYEEHAKIVQVAWSIDVLRYYLSRKYSVSKKNENSYTCILRSLKSAFCGATELNIAETRKFNFMLI